MELKVYTVRDSKGDAYDSPWTARSRGAAIRAFSDACNDAKTKLYQHPNDYTLFEVGTWDDSTGQFIPEQSKIEIGLASHFKKPDDQTEMDLN